MANPQLECCPARGLVGTLSLQHWPCPCQCSAGASGHPAWRQSLSTQRALGEVVSVCGERGVLLAHRIVERFGSEESCNRHLVQPPCHGQGHLPLDQVAQSPIQPGLEHCQGGGIHNFSGQPVPVSHHTHHKRISLPALVQFFIHQYPQVLLDRAALNEFIHQSVLILEIALTQVRDLALGCLELH